MARQTAWISSTVVALAAFISVSIPASGRATPEAGSVALEEGIDGEPIDRVAAPAVAVGLPSQFPTDPREAMEVYEAPVEDWVDGPVEYIMLEDERDIWDDLDNDLDRREFKKWFWLRRDDDTRDRVHPFKAGFYARVATANQRFPGVPKGWKTDRGRTWIVLGRPDNIRTSTGAIETWTYNTFGALSSVSYGGELQIGFRRVEATKYYVAGGIGPGVWPPYVTQAMEIVNRAVIQDPTLEFEPWSGSSG